MNITFNLMHVFNPGSNSAENALALKALLDCMVKLNLAYLRHHPVAPLYRSGVVYARTVIWEPIPALYARKTGDCKSLATALVAEYLVRGIDARPVFRFITKPNGTNDYHILVQTLTGFEDPSKILGMGAHENARFYATDGSVQSFHY